MKDKWDLLKQFDSVEYITTYDMKLILSYAYDEDPLIRGKVAALLVDFPNKKVKRVLLELSHDQDEIVRAEAYDSLVVFKQEHVERVLKRAIRNEENEFACFYAILSWTDISNEIHYNTKQQYRFICNLLKRKKVQKWEYCKLACAYARYTLGKTKKCNEILYFLNSEEYLVRSLTITLLSEIICQNNADLIHRALEECLVKEEVDFLKARIEDIIREFFVPR